MKNILLVKDYHTLFLRQNLNRPDNDNKFIGKFISIVGR
jgi:hypothetical protein